ncbi:disease resistance protein RGA2-like [Dioscorea cayenensis subsp. rotundata]|uniref:Disease resistance protein RGA2-like n=1 Tax=Dioscorea cayennensis subsp. rotundata TaxID=55577 RepID=A0AB40BSK8_DIOCR|nr:disease resistance protein RGA2-like [Dioscorea cayenensis subsp. rotundata]
MALQLLVQAALALFGDKIKDKVSDLLADHGLSTAISAFSLFGSVEPEVDKLRHTYDRIQALFKDADERRYIEDEAVKLWLRHLRDIHFEADDVLDEFRTFLGASELNSKKRKRRWYEFFMSMFPSCSPGPMLKRRRIKGTIDEIREKFDSVAEDREKLSLRPGDAKRKSNQSRESQIWQSTGSLVDESRVLGREDDLSDIVARLTENSGDDIQVISICGMGGLGKTTLAQQAFGNLRIKATFSSRMRIWVSVRKDFDVERTTREIIEAITKTNCNALNFDVLQNMLLDLLEERFLLVLDNVWWEDPMFWEALKVPLVLAKSKGKQGFGDN